MRLDCGPVDIITEIGRLKRADQTRDWANRGPGKKGSRHGGAAPSLGHPLAPPVVPALPLRPPREQQQPMRIHPCQNDRRARAAWSSPPLHVERSAFVHSCSAMQKSSPRGTTWMYIDLVVLCNGDAPPTPIMQRFAEHSVDCCQLRQCVCVQ